MLAPESASSPVRITISPEYAAQSEQLRNMGIEVRPADMNNGIYSNTSLSFTIDNTGKGKGPARDKFLVEAAKTVLSEEGLEELKKRMASESEEVRKGAAEFEAKFQVDAGKTGDRAVYEIGISRFSNNQRFWIKVDQEFFDSVRPDNRDIQSFYQKFQPLTSLSLILTKIGTETAENKLVDMPEDEKAKRREISLTCMELLLQILQDATKA